MTVEYCTLFGLKTCVYLYRVSQTLLHALLG
nr:MAG TPA: hypothetical protein [Siphoviridae sp. ctX8T1]